MGRFARTLTFFNPPPSLRQLLQTALVDTPARVIRRMQGMPEPQVGGRRGCEAVLRCG